MYELLDTLKNFFRHVFASEQRVNNQSLGLTWLKSHKSTAFNNTVAHAPFALDEVLDQFLTGFFDIFSPQLDVFCFNWPIKRQEHNGGSGEGEHGIWEPWQSALTFCHQTVTKNMSKINPKLCQVGKERRTAL